MAPDVCIYMVPELYPFQKLYTESRDHWKKMEDQKKEAYYGIKEFIGS